MADTTIGVSDRVKELLEAEKREGETYNGVILRLLDESDHTDWTEDEIRSIARQESKDMLRQYQ